MPSLLGIKTKNSLLGMKSAKHISKATTLIRSDPFVYVLNCAMKGKLCSFCFKSDFSVRRCTRCQYAYYCNQSCQKHAWSDHKIECQQMQKVYPKIPSEFVQIMARIIWKLNRGGYNTVENVSDHCLRKFKDLMSHYKEIKEDAKRSEHFSTVCQVLKEYVGEELPNSAELLGIYGRICINSFCILNESAQQIGTGLYLAPSVVDHSCDPNTVAIFDGPTLLLRTIKDIPNFSWPKVFISYIDLLTPTHSRREELSKNYYFICQCARCSNEALENDMNRVHCQLKGCEGSLVVSSLEKMTDCSDCGYRLPVELVNNYLEIRDYCDQEIERMKDFSYLDVCKLCLRRQDRLFHPNNYWRAKLVDMAFESAINVGLYEEASSLGKLLEGPYKSYYGDSHPMRGLLYLKLGKLFNYLEDYRSGIEYFKKAAIIIEVTHGLQSIFYTKTLLPLLRQCAMQNS